YDLPEDADGSTSIGLFSDWGTGYYHSRYIAKHIVGLGARCAIHLGDVYYTGRQKEFQERFIEPLGNTILRKMPFYALNANHEMDTGGHAYFDFLRMKRENPEAGWVPQNQEGSYFALVGKKIQLVALDTAYEKN